DGPTRSSTCQASDTLMVRRHSGCKIFPYTTLFRSEVRVRTGLVAAGALSRAVPGLDRGPVAAGRDGALRLDRRGRPGRDDRPRGERKSTRLNPSHVAIS